MVNGPRKLGYISGLHQIPDPFPDDPFPRLRVVRIFPLDCRFFSHWFSGGGVQPQALGLVRRLVESGVILTRGRGVNSWGWWKQGNFSLENRREIEGICWGIWPFDWWQRWMREFEQLSIHKNGGVVISWIPASVTESNIGWSRVLRWVTLK